MGYLFASGLSRPHLDYGIGVATADGDNHVLLQQTSMYLLKKGSEGQIDFGSFEFDIKSELTQEQELVLLYEMRYKQEL